MKRFVMYNIEKMKLGEMFCRNQAPLNVPDNCILYQLVEVTKLKSNEVTRFLKDCSLCGNGSKAVGRVVEVSNGENIDYKYSWFDECPNCGRKLNKK